MEFKKLNEIQRLLLKWRNKEAYRDYKFHKRVYSTPQPNLSHPFKKETHFKHSGNAGDIIYSLPAVFALAKNGKAFLHLHANQKGEYHNRYHPLGDIMLNEKIIHMLKPLLLHQPQMAACDFYTSQPVDYNLDLIRQHPFHMAKGNISRWYFHVFGIYSNLCQPWLSAPPNQAFADYMVIARSHRYRAPGISYGFLQKYTKKIFVGVTEEFEDMKQHVPNMEYYPVKDFFEMASVIKGCRLFIGNQSFPFSLAEAMKTPRLLELYYHSPNVIVEGHGGYDFMYQEHFKKAVEMLYDADNL